MDTQQLIMNGLMDLIDAGIAILVPVVVHYIFTKTNRNKVEMYSTLAKSAVNATMQTTGVTEDSFKDEAAARLATLTKGKVSTDVAGHLIDAAITELKTDVAQSVANEVAASTVPAPAPIVNVQVTTPGNQVMAKSAEATGEGAEGPQGLPTAPAVTK